MLGHDSLSICLYSMYGSNWDNILFSMFSDKKHTECMSGNFTSECIEKEACTYFGPCRTVEARRWVSLSVVKMPTEMGLSP